MIGPDNLQDDFLGVYTPAITSMSRNREIDFSSGVAYITLAKCCCTKNRNFELTVENYKVFLPMSVLNKTICTKLAQPSRTRLEDVTYVANLIIVAYNRGIPVLVQETHQQIRQANVTRKFQLPPEPRHRRKTRAIEVGFKNPRFLRFFFKTAKAQCRFLGFYFYRLI